MQQQFQQQMQQQFQLQFQALASALAQPRAALPAAPAPAAMVVPPPVQPAAIVFSGAQPPAQHAAAPHLAAYPPPPGSAGPGQLLSAVQAAAQQVSPHAAHPPSSVVDARGSIFGCGDSSVNNNYSRFISQPPAREAASDVDPGLAGTEFWDVPATGCEDRPSLAAKAPKTAAEVEAWLYDWFNHSTAAANPTQCLPVSEFVRQTVKYLAEVSDPTKVMDYFKMTMQAVKAGEYRPTQGSVYWPAETRHITPFRKPANRWPTRERGRSGTKRAAPSTPAGSSGSSGGNSSSSSGADGELKFCKEHGRCHHTTAQCRSRPAAKKARTVVSAPDAARARRAAAEEED